MFYRFTLQSSLLNFLSTVVSMRQFQPSLHLACSLLKAAGRRSAGSTSILHTVHAQHNKNKVRCADPLS